MGAVEMAMQQRENRKEFEEILFGDVPFDLGSMGCWVSEDAEHPLHQVHEPALDALLGLGLEGVEGKIGYGISETDRFIHELWTVNSQARHLSDSFGQALSGLEHSMEVIFLQKLGSAKWQDAGMYATSLEFCP